MANSFQMEEERDYKFDARLRYVENVMDAWIVFVQANTDRVVEGFSIPKQKIKFEKALYNLYTILSIHDENLGELQQNDNFYEKLTKHWLIKELTDNSTKKKDYKEEIAEDFQ